MILIPKYREIIVPMRIPIGIRGFYKIEAVDKFSGKRRVLADWFPNLITTLGGNLLGNIQAYLGTCAVGAGNTAPALGDTALQSLVASTVTTNFNNRAAQSAPPYFGSTTIQYNFAAGVATGNLSEVGVGLNTTNLFSRALILDGGGSPTTITVLSSEALYVTYQLNQYVPTADVTGTVTIASVVYNYTLRGANATQAASWALASTDAGGLQTATVFDGAIGAVTSSPSGSQSNATSYSNNSYSSGSFTASGTATWGLSVGNFGGGISAALVYFGTNSFSRGNFQNSFSPSIPKDSSHVLTLSYSETWTINNP